VVGFASLALGAGILVEEVEEGFVGLGVQMVDFVSAGEQVGDGLRRRLVHDGGADDVGHVAVIFAGRDEEVGVGVETANGGEMHVASEDGDADREFGCKSLQLLN
jgi:hypothetical protein